MNSKTDTLERLPASAGSPMPVQSEYDHENRCYTKTRDIPWAMLEPHDEQAKRNHGGQNLQVLRRRHGISACEALAILDDREWRSIPTKAAHDELERRIADWENDKMTHRVPPKIYEYTTNRRRDSVESIALFAILRLRRGIGRTPRRSLRSRRRYLHQRSRPIGVPVLLSARRSQRGRR
jgi:hypothetical protein